MVNIEKLKSILQQIRTILKKEEEESLNLNYKEERINIKKTINFFNLSKKKRIDLLLNKLIPKKDFNNSFINKRKEIFEYIVDFWQDSFFTIKYLELTDKGLNLAKRPFFFSY